jgi:hypothetical protein
MKKTGLWIGGIIGAAYAWWAVCTSWGVYPVNREAAVGCLALAGVALVLVGLGSLVGLRLRRMAPPVVRSLRELEALRAARRVVLAEDGMRRTFARRYGRLLGSLAVMPLALSASAQEALNRATPYEIRGAKLPLGPVVSNTEPVSASAPWIVVTTNIDWTEVFSNAALRGPSAACSNEMIVVDDIAYMASKGTLTNTIERLVREGQVCAVIGHRWEYAGAASEWGLQCRTTARRHCVVCGKEQQNAGEWK